MLKVIFITHLTGGKYKGLQAWTVVRFHFDANRVSVPVFSFILILLETECLWMFLGEKQRRYISAKDIAD